jgi:DNA-binding transcriptional ArsR family regulator
MVGVTHIVPVGFTSSILAESIRSRPFSKVIMVLGDNADDPDEQRARDTATDLIKSLGEIETDSIEVPSMDVYAAAKMISDVIVAEKKASQEVLVNLSGSLRTIGIAAYVAATLCGVESYIGVPKYSEGKVSGVKSVIRVPSLPLKSLFEDKQRIISSIGEDGKSMVELISILNPNLSKDDPKYNSERSRISHHIKSLKKDKLVISEKDGKEVKIRLSELGFILSKCNNLGELYD